MGMLRVAICDDEKIIANEIENLLRENCKKHNIKVGIEIYDQGKKLVKDIQRGINYDLVYLDIQMDEQDGIETAQNIRKLDGRVIIVYISGYDQYIEEVFDVDALSFIRKPIQRERFEMVLNQALKKLKDMTQYYYLTSKQMTRKIAFHEIVFWESLGRQVILHMRNGETIEYYQKINVIEEETRAKNEPFYRIHQSYLVNMDCIEDYTKNEVRVETGEILTVSRDRNEGFGLRFGNYLMGEKDD